VYRTVFEFPQHVGNGVFNKIHITSQYNIGHANADISSWEKGERYKNVQSGGTHSLRDIHNGLLYWINSSDVNGRSATSKLYIGDVSDTYVDVVDGKVYLTESENYREIDIDLSSITTPWRTDMSTPA
jgi:hypothetical protein